MELPYYYTEATWQGNEIHLPMNHTLTEYAKPDTHSGRSAINYLVDCRYLPDVEVEDYEANLNFQVTMDLPLNECGELYYTWFADARNFNVLDLNAAGTALRVTYRASSVCHIYDPSDWEPGVESCGLAVALKAEDPTLDTAELEDDLEDAHTCEGQIEDSLWMAFEVGQPYLKNDEVREWAYEMPVGADLGLASLADTELWLRYAGDDTIIKELTLHGKTYRFILITHQD